MASNSITLSTLASHLTSAPINRFKSLSSLQTSNCNALPLPQKIQTPSKLTIQCSISDKTLSGSLRTGLAALTLSATLQLSSLVGTPALASEINVLQSPVPTETHLVDDAGVLNRVTKSDLKRLLTDLEEKTGYHIDFVTIRKSTGKSDAFEFADKVLETWYPTLEEGTNKAIVLLITSQKEAAFSGGPSATEALGDEVIEAILSENLPVLATDEKYNEAIYSTAKRLVAKLNGEPDIPGPRFDENKRIANYKTKEETSNKRDQFSLVVGGLLVIAFVVPMAQYYAYVAKK